MEEKIQEGGFDGLAGFSEGAALAAVVTARAALGEEGASTNLKFAVMCGGAFPTPYEELLERCREIARRAASSP